MRYALTFRLERTRRADVQSSDSETLSRIRSLAGYIIVTRESDFSEATAAVFCPSSRAPKSVVDFTDFDESGTGPGGNIARFEEAA